MSPTRQDRNESIARMRRQQILNAALEIFSIKGVDATTTTEIAEAARISHGTIYNYFPRKRDILLALVDQYVPKDPVTSNFNGIANGDAAHLFSSMIQNRLNVSFDHNKEINLIMSEIQRDPELHLLYAENTIKPVLEISQHLFKAGVSDGVFRNVDNEVAVRTIMAVLIGLTLIYKVEGKEGLLTKIDRRELAGKIEDILLYGLSATNNALTNDKNRRK